MIGRDFSSIRRVVTGVDKDGRSCVVADEIVPCAGLGTMLWESDPPRNAPWVTTIPDDAVPPIEPVAGGSHAMMIRLAPADEDVILPKIPNVDERGFHATRTIDYALVLEGEVELALDRETVTLGSGDMVVQQATNHAWRNRTKLPALFLVVLTSASPRRKAGA